MDDRTPDADIGGPSRRDLLRRSALVGGTLVWMAPVVQTLATPAYAGSTAPGGPTCLYSFFLKFDPAHGFADDEGVGNITCRPAGYGTTIKVPSLGANTGSGGTYTQSITVDGTLIGSATGYATTTPGCVHITLTGFTVDGDSSYFVFKDGGGNGCDVGDNGTLGPDADDGDFDFCEPSLSHVDLVLCVTQE